MRREFFKNVIFVTTTLIIAVLSVILPGVILDYLNRQEVSDLRDVPAEYYAGPSESVILNSSRQLSDLENLHLVTGIWESEVTTVNPSSCRLTDVDARTLASMRMSNLYNKEIYPVDLSSDVNQWYAWDATAYRAIDTTFRTYAANFWRITFYKYDHTEKHTIIMTETGAIVYAHAEMSEGGKLDSFLPNTDRIGYLLLIDRESRKYLTEILGDQTHYTLVEGTKRLIDKDMSDEDLKEFDVNAASHYTPISENFTPDSGVMIYDDDDSVNFNVYIQKDDKNYTVIVEP